MAAPEQATVPERLRDEVRELTRELIRIDTSNPPGRESIAAEFIAGYLSEAGVEAELAGPDPERLNLIARIAGRGEGPSLMLMAHTDVVPAPDADWTVPPFAGELRDGRVVGRGAADMKGELAARIVAIAEIARSGEAPPGDVVLIAESDEERNTYDVGMSWLVRERPDVRCDYALNEGGGMLLELAGGRRVVTISIGEKQVASLLLRFHGRAGHASVPAGADNVLDRAATAVHRLLAYDAPARLTPPVAAALDGLGAPVGDGPGAAVAWAASQHPVLAGMVPAMTRMTVTPTGLQTHEPANVIPPFADVICDCRALPGQTLDDVREHVERALDGLEHELELLEPLAGGTESVIDTPLYRICEEHVRERLPGAELLPIVTPGFTDSHWVRSAHGTVAYGFAPVFTTPLDVYLDGMHGADEAVDVADLAEMTAFNLRAIRSLGF
ncbi:MAG TPA: M20/M25/M40 family metallo-hydrolase [Solirubrobacterales bacterium]|nr:M20/M25/M40 family metallo-hydrolase [Solirubrobacterales bacterium]